MKEIIAVIRPKKVSATKDALVKLGYPSLTAIPVLGRGKQKGLENEINIEFRPGTLDLNRHVAMKYIPKRYLSIVIPDDEVEAVIQAIIKTNQTDQIGDGKIFVCPVEEALRIRTEEQGNSAIN